MQINGLLTIGYEGADLVDFLTTLQSLEVDLLLDIREVAISRRKGFAKTALKAALASVGIAYLHEKRLGSPKAIRDELRNTGNYSKFFRDFQVYLDSQKQLVGTLAENLRGTIVLLCYERDHTICHRRAVAEAFSTCTGLKPYHRGVRRDAQRQVLTHARSDSG